MTIYFSVSWSNMNENIRSSCSRMINEMNKQGNIIVPEKVMEKSKIDFSKQTEEERNVEQKKIEILKRKCNISVFEVTNPSTGIGQEINEALFHEKPVICMHDEKVAVHLLNSDSPLLQIIPYNPKNVEKLMGMALDFAASQQKIRFHLTITPGLLAYLKFCSRQTGVSKSNIIRRLILDKMIVDDRYIPKAFS